MFTSRLRLAVRRYQVMLGRRLPERFDAAALFGVIRLRRPPFSLNVEHPAETGFLPRNSRVEKKIISGNVLVSAKNAVAVPGGIVLRGTRLHIESFPYRQRFQTTRFIKKKGETKPYFVLPAWRGCLISSAVPEGVFLDGEYADHYGHFLTECLPRLWGVLHYPRLQRAPILTSFQNIEMVRFFLDALGLANMQIEQIQEPTRIKRLWLASSAYRLGIGFTGEAKMIFKKVSERFRHKEPGEKLFLSRQHLETRTPRLLLNEREVEEEFGNAGFRIISPHTMPLADQLRYFSNATLIAGPTGTVMYNRVFQQQSGKAILLGAHNYILSDHAYLAALMGQEQALVINGEVDQGDAQSASWRVDVEELRHQLASLQS